MYIVWDALKKSECIVKAMTKFYDDVSRRGTWNVISVVVEANSIQPRTRTLFCTLSAAFIQISIKLYRDLAEGFDHLWKWTPSCPKLDHIRISLFPKTEAVINQLVNLIFSTSCAKHRSLKIRAQNNSIFNVAVGFEIYTRSLIFFCFLFLLITYFCALRCNVTV